MNAPAPASPSIRFGVTGVSCASCAGRWDRALPAPPAVPSASVNPATASATVEPDGRPTTADRAEAVRKAGYGALLEESTPAPEQARMRSASARRELRHLIIAAL